MFLFTRAQQQQNRTTYCYLICTRSVSQGGQLSRAAGRQTQGLPGNVLSAQACASVSTLLLYALGLVVRCPAARVVQKGRLAFYQL